MLYNIYCIFRYIKYIVYYIKYVFYIMRTQVFIYLTISRMDLFKF